MSITRIIAMVIAFFGLLCGPVFYMIAEATSGKGDETTLMIGIVCVIIGVIGLK